ncbi:type II toxin-antitoxin system VapC family toxin [Brevundimonas aurantiaca]|jgi:tRNA(fMet)-specific endonuclease VapC|uniref:type II toxin-antitoxin system VapC family toxin n=1 Tax=Brevundimonas aurantiaca TaxID=74316 RepID=UPI000C8F216D|nr:type II toxin-antitoxin system VapC family toxin [Brevundimonas aurantiaca]MAL57305.1 VapC toxin family PIN domain ribonuclease [Brevundimonas sp.]MCC4294437.1 type II toxin-antitoxin system VapC family toxin [Brevundimonas aurantiaca]HAF80153.1 VapC toxin family PIN domain ribonuclease [Brevundimonas sp.]
MLDTNAVSDLMYDPIGPVGQRLALLGPVGVCVSLIAVAELRFGACKSGSPRIAMQLERVLSGLAVKAWDAPADRLYGEVRAELQRSGRLIGANDLLIAAHALALDCILVTDNEREFSRVPGLRVENWLREP